MLHIDVPPTCRTAMHAAMHAAVRTGMCKGTCTGISAAMHAGMHAAMHAGMHAGMHADMHAAMHAGMRAGMCAWACVQACVPGHACRYAPQGSQNFVETVSRHATRTCPTHRVNNYNAQAMYRQSSLKPHRQFTLNNTMPLKKMPR